jgi:hypothetical protein
MDENAALLLLSRKVNLSILSDIAAKNKSAASLPLRNFFHVLSEVLLADSRQRARCTIAAKKQSAGLRVLSFPFHGIGLGSVLGSLDKPALNLFCSCQITFCLFCLVISGIIRTFAS